jgi:hypothetical protein
MDHLLKLEPMYATACGFASAGGGQEVFIGIIILASTAAYLVWMIKRKL